MKFAGCILALVCAVITAPFSNAIEPSKVAVLAAKGNAKSEALAKYYAQKRSIPETNILYLEFASEDELERGLWNSTVKPAVKTWLNQDGRKNQIECVVTVRGVSINVVGKDAPEAIAVLEAFALSEEKSLIERVIESEKKLKDIAGDTSAALSLDAIKELSVTDLGKRLNTFMEAANKKLSGMSPSSPQVQSFAPVLLELGGIDLMVTILNNSMKQLEGQNTQQAQLNMSSLMGSAESLAFMLNATAQSVPTPEIVKLRASTVERRNGLLGALEFYRKQRAELTAERTTSLDSELSAVLWSETPQFQTAAPNFRALIKGHYSSLKDIYPTLMVGRIDAPTWPICKRMIDDALSSEGHAVEAAKFYFDLRGLDPKSATPGEVGLEQALTLVSQAYEKNFPDKSKVNKEPGLFDENSCPDVFVYCGWLEPGKYSKIGNWLAGSIGYHISPISASELHTAESEAWCNRMLTDGAGVVIGATDFLAYEYMLSPGVFVPENFDGTKTIVESYYDNLAYVRTTNVLLGDPLYRPKLK